jgi:hypothetical protein
MVVRRAKQFVIEPVRFKVGKKTKMVLAVLITAQVFCAIGIVWTEEIEAMLDAKISSNVMKMIWNSAYENESFNHSFNCVYMSLAISETLEEHHVSHAIVTGWMPGNVTGHCWIYLNGRHLDSTTLEYMDDLPKIFYVDLKYYYQNETIPDPIWTNIFSNAFT